MEVTRQLSCILIGFGQDGLVSPLEQMPGTLALDVEIGRVSSIDVSHDLGKVSRRDFSRSFWLLNISFWSFPRDVT